MRGSKKEEAKDTGTMALLLNIPIFFLLLTMTSEPPPPPIGKQNIGVYHVSLYPTLGKKFLDLRIHVLISVRDVPE